MKQLHQFALAAAAALTLNGAAMLPSQAAEAAAKPTIVLVHGAFADSSSWDGVTAKLLADGYSVVGAANPLRSVKGDAVTVSGIVKGIKGPVVLVGHSYGGSVISAAANGNGNVKSLVYVAAFAPEAGENAIGLSGRFPGSTLGPTLAPPVILADGSKDLYIQQAQFPQQFAADVPLAQAQLMAAGQRPIAEAALTEAAGAPAWKTVPSYFVYGSADKNIPAAALGFMAQRAKSVKTLVIPGASHVVMTSHPAEVAGLIEEAAKAR
ncbi:alpha/beta fold hydrolase [Janthinobacterium agaricidamnosum]|uniref:Alpha/beta hydrolase fold family protein n=1 Tax=Janthinobacterium agaricidamnosum NBRC 102515 = DSM 9628 TaxID=1349767 RepID=W0VEV3_9BURK|nr:alpha/beta hydrolase [Janthinobacterium agaricidamnosum]CDG85958.1 alpha/beta hydrolase fold family protein [Janthinobacterium agaricidamnosum NBRC 102515 = DSM 9628]